MNTPAVTSSAITETKEKRIFTTAETIFAWLSVLFGYLFCRAFPATEKTFGAFLFMVALCGATAVILAVNNATFGAVSIISAATSVALSFSMLFTQNTTIHFFAYTFCIFAYALFVYTAYGNHSKDSFARLFPLDFLVALFVSPFRSMYELGNGLLANGKINTRPLLKILLGVIITLIPTAIVVLLLSYDSDFTDLLEKIFDFEFTKFMSHLGSFILGIPIGMCIYGAFISSADKTCKNICSEEKIKKHTSKIKIVPQITAISAILPILAVYTLFFVSQWKYYVSGFVGVLPDETSYADYARDGFFQLCSVAIINFIIIAVIGIFVRRKGETPSVTEKILSLLLSLSTLILIATAIAKMIMYIDIYGLTPKRLYATWFMVVLAIIFVLTIIKQFANKLPLILISVCIVILLFSILAFAQTDRIIAEYNVDRYLDGSLKNVDINMLEDLGDAAIPSMVRVLKYWSDEYGYDYKLFFNGQLSTHLQGNFPQTPEFWDYTNLCKSLRKLASLRKKTFWNYTLLRDEADKALSEIGLTDIAEKAEGSTQ